MTDTCWHKLISEEMKRHDEKWDDVVSCTLSDEDLHVTFNPGYGGSEGKPFTLWTDSRAYFPVVYDGLEGVDSVSRNPDGIPTDHVGGQ